MQNPSITLFLFVVMLTGCGTTNVCLPGEGRPLVAGTQAQVVKVSLDAAGKPAVDVEPVIALPGERVIFAGPPVFTLRFVNDSPLSPREFLTEFGALSLALPKRDFSQRDFLNSIENVELSVLLNNHQGIRVYPYEILVNGKSLTSHLIMPE